MPNTEPPRKAPPHLWREIQALLTQLFALFGEPQQIAFQLTSGAHKLLSKWLRGTEALMRQLLLIEASALSPPLEGRGQGAGAVAKSGAPRPKRFIEHHDDKPEQWRVSFRFFTQRQLSSRTASRRGRRRSIIERDFRYRDFDLERTTSAASLRQAQPTSDAQTSASLSPSKGARAEPSAANRFRSAWPLAERAEALLRVFNNPNPYARRLTRKLRAKPALAQSFHIAPNAHRGVLPEPVLEETQTLIASLAPNSS